jgi:hypothetical protein
MGVYRWRDTGRSEGANTCINAGSTSSTKLHAEKVM